MCVLEPDFDREEVADWLARRYGDRELAQRVLSLSGLRFSASVEAELLETLSALGSVVLARELVRNAWSEQEFEDFCREVEPPPPGSRIRRSRGPSRGLLVKLSAR